MQAKEDQLKQAFWRLRNNPGQTSEDELVLHVFDQKDRFTVHNLSIKVYLNYGQEYSTRANLASKKAIANNQPTSDLEDEELVATCKFRNYYFKCLLDDKTDEILVSLDCNEFEYVGMEIANQDCRFLHIDLSNQILTKLKDDIRNLQPLSGLNFVTYGMPKQVSDEGGSDLVPQNPLDEFRELDEYQGLPIELINWDGVNFEDEEVYGYQPSGNDRGWFEFPADTARKISPADCPGNGMLIENLDEYLQKEICKSAPPHELEKRKPDLFDNMKKALAQSKQNQPSTSTSGAPVPAKQPLSGAVFRSSGLSNLSASVPPTPAAVPPPTQNHEAQKQQQQQPTRGAVEVPMQPLSAADLEAELGDLDLPLANGPVSSDGRVKPNNPLGPQTPGFAAAAAFY